MEGCLSIRTVPVVELAILNFSIFNQVAFKIPKNVFGGLNNQIKDVCTKEFIKHIQVTTTHATLLKPSPSPGEAIFNGAI